MQIRSENDWLSCDEPDEMLRYLRRKKLAPSPRKVRLFSVACCHCFGSLLDDRSRTGLEVAERHADGQATTEELAAAHEPLLQRNWPPPGRSRFPLTDLEGRRGEREVRVVASYVWNSVEGATRPGKPDSSRVLFAAHVTPECDPVVQASICREVFGNPFRATPFDASWRTSSVSRLAQTIYEERAFDRLPILGDALEEAGCPSAEIVSHCREPGDHVRGCWVIDLVLEKT